MKWGESVRSKTGTDATATTGTSSRRARKPWLSDKKAAQQTTSFELDQHIDSLVSSSLSVTSPTTASSPSAALYDSHSSGINNDDPIIPPMSLSKRTKKSSSRTLLNTTSPSPSSSPHSPLENPNLIDDEPIQISSQRRNIIDKYHHDNNDNDPTTTTDHTESTITESTSMNHLYSESLDTSDNYDNVIITEHTPTASQQQSSNENSSPDKTLVQPQLPLYGYDLPTSSPVLDVIKRLQEPSSSSSVTKTRFYDIPTLEVPVKEKAYDYESGKLLHQQHSKNASHLSAELLHMVIEEGMVMKKVETVEMTEQQLLRKQLAIAAAAVANRRMAEELARRTAAQQMEAAIEHAEQEEVRRIKEEEAEVVRQQQEMLQQQRRKQKEQDELEVLRQQKNDAKRKAAMEQQQEEETERANETARLLKQQEEAEIELQKELRQRIEDAKAKAKAAAMVQLIQPPNDTNTTVAPSADAMDATSDDNASSNLTSNTTSSSIVGVDNRNVVAITPSPSVGAYDDDTAVIIQMTESIGSKRSSSFNNHHHDVIHEEEEEEDDDDEEEEDIENDVNVKDVPIEENEFAEQEVNVIEEDDQCQDDVVNDGDNHPSAICCPALDVDDTRVDDEVNVVMQLPITPIEDIASTTPSDSRNEDTVDELPSSPLLKVAVDEEVLESSPTDDVAPIPRTEEGDEDYHEDPVVVAEDTIAEPDVLKDVNDNEVLTTSTPMVQHRTKPEPIITSLPTPVATTQPYSSNDDDENFIEEEVNVEENAPFHHLPSTLEQQQVQKPPQTVIANHNFDQRNNIPDDVSNFSNDDSSLLQQQQYTSSSTPSQLFHKSSNHSTATTTGGSSATSQNNNVTGTPSPRRSISDIIRHDLWNTNETIVEQALQQLVEKASIHNSYRSAIARAGGILAIIRAMEQHMNHVGIQIASCLALEKLAIDTENELAIGEVGGVEAILSAMMAHYTNGAVQEAAWSALWNCTCGNACDTMTIDTTPGGMTAVISCMKQHVDNVTVQVSACNTIMNLCYDNNERVQLLVEADGFGAITQAIQTHYSNVTIRNEMSYILCTLLEKNVKQHYISQQQQQDHDDDDDLDEEKLGNREIDDDDEYEEEVFDEEAL